MALIAAKVSYQQQKVHGLVLTNNGNKNQRGRKKQEAKPDQSL